MNHEFHITGFLSASHLPRKREHQYKAWGHLEKNTYNTVFQSALLILCSHFSFFLSWKSLHFSCLSFFARVLPHILSSSHLARTQGSLFYSLLTHWGTWSPAGFYSWPLLCWTWSRWWSCITFLSWGHDIILGKGEPVQRPYETVIGGAPVVPRVEYLYASVLTAETPVWFLPMVLYIACLPPLSPIPSCLTLHE